MKIKPYIPPVYRLTEKNLRIHGFLDTEEKRDAFKAMEEREPIIPPVYCLTEENLRVHEFLDTEEKRNAFKAMEEREPIIVMNALLDNFNFEVETILYLLSFKKNLLFYAGIYEKIAFILRREGRRTENSLESFNEKITSLMSLAFNTAEYIKIPSFSKGFNEALLECTSFSGIKFLFATINDADEEVNFDHLRATIREVFSID